MELQTIFNMVIQHLIRQGKSAVTPHGCAYRGVGDTKCAVGYLISDNNYNCEIEGDSIVDRDVLGAVKATIGSIGEAHKHLLLELQGIHDNELDMYSTCLGSVKTESLVSFVRSVERLAQTHNLIVPRALYDFCKAHA